MAIVFPASPSVNETFTEGSITYKWDGAKWIGLGVTPADRLVEGSNSLEITSGNDLVWTGDSVLLGTPTSNTSDRFTIVDPGNVFMSIRSDAASDDTNQVLDFAVGTDNRSSLNLTGAIQTVIHSQSGGTLKSDMLFSTNGGNSFSERLRITSDGYARLTTANARLEWTASSGSNPFIRSIGSGQQELEFNTGSNERLRITSDGTILAGGQTSSYDGAFVNLELRNDSTTVGGSMTLVNDQSAEAGATCQIDCYQNFRSAGKIVFGRENANNWQASAAGADSFLAFHTNNSGTEAEKFRVTSTGEVGTQLKITLRENLIDAFSLDSNGANGYFRIVDEYDTFERLRIHGDGGFSINTTTLSNYDQTDNTRNLDTTSSSVGGNFAFRRDKGTMLIANDANPGWALMYLNKFNWTTGDDDRWAAFYLNGSPKDTITWNGSNVIFGGASDYRIKENIRDFTGGIEKVKQLKVHLFDYIETDRGNDRVGFIAHELQEVVPEAVSGEKDGMRKEEETGEDVMNVQMVEYGKITPVLTAALQEAIAEIETLRARLDAAGL